MQILKTRLYKPPLSDKFIIRERLIARLNNESDRPLKLIVAGAGYGKSVLMSQWLDTYPGKYCWISLEMVNQPCLDYYKIFF
jgi:LuxR family maltose regulon positive regulatory protein